MKMKSILLAMVLVWSMLVTPVFADIMIKGDPANMPTWLYVQGVGKMKIIGGVVKASQIMNLEKQLGHKIKLPSKVDVFLPTVGNQPATYASISSGFVDDNVTLKPARKAEGPGVLRTFHGPLVVDKWDNPIEDVSIWFHGTQTHESSGGGGILNPAVYMPVDQKNLTMILYKPGYAMQAIGITVPKEMMKDDKAKAPLLDDNVVMQPESNRVVELTLTNYGSLIYQGAKQESGYYVDGSGDYVYLYTVNDLHGKRDYYALLDLSITTLLVQASYKMELTKMDKDLSPGTKIDKAALPSVLPRVNLINKLKFRSIPKDPKPELAYDDGKTRTDPFFIFVVLALLAVAVGFGIWYMGKEALRKKEEMDFNRKQEEEAAIRQQQTVDHQLFETIGAPADGVEVMVKAQSLLEEKDLNAASANSISSVLIQIRYLMTSIKNLWIKSQDIEGLIKRHADFQIEQLKFLKDCFAKGHYDVAKSHQEAIKSSKDQQKSISDGKLELDKNIQQRKDSLIDLIGILRKMNIRADALISQLDSAEDLNDLSTSAVSVFEQVSEAFVTENMDKLNPESLARLQKERQKAQNVGVSDGDIAELKRFIDKTSVNNLHEKENCMKFKRVYRLFLILIVFAAFTGCSKVEDTGLSEVGVTRMGAFIRSEGGGVQDQETMPGRNKITTTGTSYKHVNQCFTPRILTIVQDVLMVNMRNQKLTFTPSLEYMLIPNQVSLLQKDFPNFDREIEKIFREVCMQVLSPLEMGLDLDVELNEDSDQKSEEPAVVVKTGKEILTFDSREKVSAKLLEKFKSNFENIYPKYVKCFGFIDCAVGNVDFPKGVITKLEEAVGKTYDSELLKIQAMAEDLEGQIYVAQSESDLNASGIEAGAMDDDVLRYMSGDLFDQFASNENINVVAMIPLDRNGFFDWFNVDFRVHDKK